MRIVSLTLEHFRNYALQMLTISDADLQLFVGPNGSGKTNLLEAMSVLSLTRSCRGKDDADMVEWETAHYRIRGVVRSDAGEEWTMEVVTELAPRKRRAFFINDVRSPLGSFVGTLPTVTFLPEDLELFSGAPSERRRFLDELLSQVSPAYFDSLSSYQKILQQRNALLKRIAGGEDRPDALDVWDMEIAPRAAAITLARLEMIEALNMSFLEEIGSLGETWSNATLRYERKSECRDLPSLSRELAALLRTHRDRDVAMQTTSLGPHREDWQVYRDDRSIPSFASRGQERVAVLALLLLQVSYLELRRSEKPVILLDDAFSELDDAHQGALLDAFRGHQVMMTATRVPPRAEGAAIHRVEHGVVHSSSSVGRGLR